jgi:hypothetical protein
VTYLAADLRIKHSPNTLQNLNLLKITDVPMP